MIKCPNCGEDVREPVGGEWDDQTDIFLEHIFRYHDDACFFCERINNKSKGDRLIGYYWLCPSHAMVLKTHKPDVIRKIFGMDVEVEELQKSLGNECEIPEKQ
jgi:hypothetical protein